MKDNRLLFLSICLPLRIGFVIASALLSNHKEFRLTAGILAILVSLGFIRSHLANSPLGFFGNKRYWPSLLHGIIYAIFAGLILSDRSDLWEHAWIVLAIDICLGAIVVTYAYS